MKKIIIIIAMITIVSICKAQITNPAVRADTAKVDSAQVEKINKMPMDSTHLKTPAEIKDTTFHRRMGDDEDPKRNSPKK